MSASEPKSIAYLTATFPALSHTFILREILALEETGLRIVPVSVREPLPKDVIGDAEQAMRKRTHYLLKEAKKPLALLRAQVSALKTPGRYLRTLGLALKTRAPGIRALLYQMIYFSEATLLAAYVRKTGCDQIHNHFANSSGTVAMLAAKLAGVSFSFTLHGPSDLFDAKHWRLDRKIAEAEFVACISHFARSQAMLNSDPVHWPKLRIVHCGVVPDLYKGGPPAGKGAMRLIFVGRLAPVKGLRLLMEAFAHALETCPDLELTIVGDGPDKALLTQFANQIGSQARLTGPLSQAEVAKELAQADAMVLPSLAEGVPVVLMEAMASERAVIATRVAGVSELVEHGVSGLLVSPGDVAGLRNAIVKLATDAKTRKAMGQAGREKVVAEFDIEIEAAWLSEIFNGNAGDRLRPVMPA